MTEERYWQAVLERNHAFDNRFVYAVRSTGIYCRPSCPARRPRREQVLFFAQPAAAVDAGYRACRRCHPDQMAPAERQAVLVERICRLIEAAPEPPPTLEYLGAQAGVDTTTLRRLFRRVLGITPRQYADAARLGRLKVKLKEGEAVTNALYEAGYGSSSRLYEQAPGHLGMTPATYGRSGQGMTIRYTIVSSPIGCLLVAATERGLCAVHFGDDESLLKAALTNEFSAATVTRDDRAFIPWVTLLLAHLAGRQPRLDLPLDLQATAFQRRVWEALRAIPPGQTRSYSAVAAAIGQPAATRAVAQACASNPVAMVIPCHRVIREDGSLGGYRWGVERKRQLLEHEQRNPA